MSIDEILGEMDDLLDKALTVPIVSNKKVVDGERMRELINDVRLNMPHELKAAQKIEFDCQRILNEAKMNAEAIIRKAEERAAQIVSKEAIVTEAEKRAEEILRKAQANAKNVQSTMALSLAKMLNDTETMYNRNLMDIKRTKEKLMATIKSSQSVNQNISNDDSNRG